MKNIPKLKFGQVGSWFEHCSNSFAYIPGSNIRSLFVRIHVKRSPKLALCKAGSNIAYNFSLGPKEARSGDYMDYMSSSHEKFTKSEIMSSCNR